MCVLHHQLFPMRCGNYHEHELYKGWGMETEFKVGQTFVMLKNVGCLKKNHLVYFIKQQQDHLVLVENADGFDWWCTLGEDCAPYGDRIHGLISITPTEDVVNHPSHYTSGDIEYVDGIRACLTREEFIGFLRGQIIRYTCGMNNKGNLLQDTKNSVWYSNKLISVLEEE